MTIPRLPRCPATARRRYRCKVCLLLTLSASTLLRAFRISSLLNHCGSLRARDICGSRLAEADLLSRHCRLLIGYRSIFASERLVIVAEWRDDSVQMVKSKLGALVQLCDARHELVDLAHPLLYPSHCAGW